MTILFTDVEIFAGTFGTFIYKKLKKKIYTNIYFLKNPISILSQGLYYKLLFTSFASQRNLVHQTLQRRPTIVNVSVEVGTKKLIHGDIIVCFFNRRLCSLNQVRPKYLQLIIDFVVPLPFSRRFLTKSSKTLLQRRGWFLINSAIRGSPWVPFILKFSVCLRSCGRGRLFLGLSSGQ